MRVDDVSRASPAEQLAYLLAVVGVQRLDANASQYTRQVDLRAVIAPDLADYRRACAQWCSLLLEHAQLGSHHAVAAVNGDQRPGVEYRLHATSERAGRPSRDAAASSSASVKGRSPASHASSAAPSSSFLSRSAAASLSHADTLVPCRAAA